ncbi:MAG: tRNA (N(6)-L-threonylcarbamoyladenosine(37)-C(2))-methylthiotransferase MtaB [Candidatus Riflebacteria bacterium]|nr:tRNA (N(6)-L-threonylcarbamoyladenosine(37)-C(2))-methylthiotransferase MtaB [Candidatus Riflebacteria bacterium]
MYKFFIHSFGCKVSQYDGDRLSQLLLDLGFEKSDDAADSDLIIINGCAVTGRASQKARQALRSAKRKNPSAIAVITGCEAKRAGIQDDDSYTEYESLDSSISENSLKEWLAEKGFQQKDVSFASSHLNMPVSERTRAFLKLQDGCSHYCTYCIVPYLRGDEYSKKPSEAVSEARLIAESGRHEIVLTGIHLGKYLYDLPALIREIEKIDGIERVRLSSIEPLEIKDEIISWMAESSHSCHHLHIPLQSGCSKILTRMNRPYNTSEFEKIINRIRKVMPDIAISTDLIVGFPGETEDEFNETVEFVRKMKFSKIHIFKYSIRPGTPAAKYPGQLPNEIKQARSKVIEQVWKESSAEFHRKFIGKQLEVLWEFKDNGNWEGFSREYIRCLISEKLVEGDISNTLSRVTVNEVDSEGAMVVLKNSCEGL